MASLRKEVKSGGSTDTHSIKEGNISLILDSYGDLFSDFDPRPYSEKALSRDFLDECRSASRDKPGKGIVLRLLMPEKERNLITEGNVKKRLQAHFKHHYEEELEDRKKIRRKGIIWIIIGAIISIFGALFLYHDGLVYNLLLVVFEPAGWFTIWSGLDILFFGSKEVEEDLKFHEKMSRVDIEFKSYGTH